MIRLNEFRLSKTCSTIGGLHESNVRSATLGAAEVIVQSHDVRFDFGNLCQD